MIKVAILQHRLLHYRVELFERLRAAGEQRGVAFELVHGQASRREQVKRDEGHLPWAHKMINRVVEMGPIDLIWQPYPKDLREVDLIILIQENRVLSNYSHLLLKSFRHPLIAFWGHGRNLQSRAPDGWRERFKRFFVNRVDWWFAYTDSTRELLVQDGFAPDKITVLNNAIDNEAFTRDLQSITDEELAAGRSAINATEHSPVGLYCGSLYGDKKLDLMIAACDLIHAERPDFRLVVIGDGPAASIVKEAMDTRPWLHWPGSQRGRDKAKWFRLASAYLSPGAMGLHVLDAFCAGLPILTTSTARHGPEIAYLKHDHNGFMLPDNADLYAQTFLNLMSNAQRVADIRQQALADARHYTLDSMVNRFVDGVVRCVVKRAR